MSTPPEMSRTKPGGVAPEVRPNVRAAWDSDTGCWRTPGGSKHLVQRNRKRKLAATDARTVCMDIDAELAVAGRYAPCAVWVYEPTFSSDVCSWRTPDGVVVRNEGVDAFKLHLPPQLAWVTHHQANILPRM